VFDLYAITPEQPAVAIERSVERILAIDRPARIGVLLRAKHLPHEERRALGRSLRTLTAARGAALLISADLALCEALGADGVQLPERGPSVADARATLGAASCIGASRHDALGLARAALEGATFATLSPVYASPDKGAPLGDAAFTALTRAAALPVLALGGIEHGRAGGLICRGAAGIAVIRALFDHEDPTVAAANLLTEIDHAREELTTNRGGHNL
jgi:thiamine-phosphate pyrophosphorylase